MGRFAGTDSSLLCESCGADSGGYSLAAQAVICAQCERALVGRPAPPALSARPTWSMRNEPSLEVAVGLSMAARIADLLEAGGSPVEAAEIRRALAERKLIDDAQPGAELVQEEW